VATTLRLIGAVVLLALFASACGTTTTASRASTLASCRYAAHLKPVPAPNTHDEATFIVFAWPKSFIAGLEHSNIAVLTKLGSELVTTDNENRVATNKAVARLKAVCERLPR
jgi:hypothetical protein